MKKILPNKFSVNNNMDPEEVPEKLQEFMKIEEMLILKVFIVISVYKLCDGQNGYRENIINFLQDIQEFTI